MKIGDRKPPTITMDRLYKVVGTNGTAIHGGTGDWILPTEAEPGDWMPAIQKPQCCKQGYHLVVRDAVDEWINRRYPIPVRIFRAEGRGKFDSDGTGKIAFESARLLSEVSFAMIYGDEYNEYVNLPKRQGFDGVSHRYPSHYPSPSCLRRCEYKPLSV